MNLRSLLHQEAEFPLSNSFPSHKIKKSFMQFRFNFSAICYLLLKETQVIAKMPK